MKQRNAELAFIQKNDCKRLRERTVESKKGKGRKDRPRKKSDWDNDGWHFAA